MLSYLVVMAMAASVAGPLAFMAFTRS